MQRKRTREMMQVALCAAMLCVASYLVIPLPFTPVVLSMHTMAVNLAGLILKPKQALCAVGIYLAMGLCGLPVFAAGTAGMGKLFGPTGGFYIGFLPAAVLISLLKGKDGKFWRHAAVCICVGIPIQHLTAVFWMAHFGNVDIWAAVWTASVPFLAGDIAKCLLSAAAAAALRRALKHSGN